MVFRNDRMVIVGVEDAKRKFVGVPNERIATILDVIVPATRRNIKPVLELDPPARRVFDRWETFGLMRFRLIRDIRHLLSETCFLGYIERLSFTGRSGKRMLW